MKSKNHNPYSVCTICGKENLSPEDVSGYDLRPVHRVYCERCLFPRQKKENKNGKK